MATENALPPAAKASSLAGRDAEFATLQDRFARSANGRANVVLAVGEPGIGKTRLLEEVASRAAQQGARLLRGGASEIEGMPPYLPFLQAIGGYIRTAPRDQLRVQAGERATTLASIFPELTTRLGKLPKGYALLPEQARLRLYEAVGAFLKAIAEPRPLVLLLDDLQWADAASLDLLCHVACNQPLARLLILGAYREGEASANAGLTRAVDHLNRYRLLTTLTLTPLSAKDVMALATSYLGGAVHPIVGHLLHRHSEGNPFFAEELLRGWLEAGGLTQGENSWVLTPALDPDRIPPGITGAVHQRLTRLAPEVVDQLQTAAIIGRTFDVTVLAAAEQHAAESVEAGLGAAVRAKLIRADEAGTYTFQHDKIRECLYAEIAPARRQRLHEAIGRALEARGTHDNLQGLAVLAFHFVRSGDRERGAMYSSRAAEKALSAYAAEEALAHYRAALALLPPDDNRCGSLLLGLGRAAGLTEATREAADAFRAAQNWARQKGDRTVAVRATRELGWVLSERLGQYAAAREACEAAVALTQGQSGPEAVYALADLAELEPFIGLYHEGLAHAEHALQLARILGDPLPEAKAYRALGRVLTRMNSIRGGVEALEQALALATQADDPVEAATCCYRLEYVTMNTGKLKRCRELCLTRMVLARRSHDAYELCHAQAWLSYVAALQGNWSEVEELVSLVQPAAEHLASSGPLTFLLKAGGFMAYQRGEYQVAEQKLLALEVLFRKTPEAVGRYRGGLLGLAHLGAADRDGAQAYLAEYEALLSSMPEGNTPTAPILTTLAMMALVTGDRQRAMQYYSRLLPFQGQHYWFLVDRILAAIEVLQGDWVAAQAHLDAAENHARREDLRPELPLVLAGRAGLELARGGRGSAMRARALLEQALPLFEQLGMADEATRTRDRLRGLPRQAGGPGSPFYPARLSAREVQVLKLVAAGMSNRQIAQELALSERTVINHVASIFNKTNLDKRSAATAFAIRHGLA